MGQRALVILLIALALCVSWTHCMYSVQKSQLIGKITQFEWAGPNNAVALTDKNLFVSNDGGKSWTIQNLSFCNTAHGCYAKFYVSPVDPKFVYVLSTPNSGMWFSDDVSKSDYSQNRFRKISFFEGQNYEYFIDFSFHPTEKNVAFVLVSKKSLIPPSQQTDDQLVHDLFVTHDFGHSWEKVAEEVKTAAWGSKALLNYEPDLIYGIKKGILGYPIFFSANSKKPMTPVAELMHNADDFFHFENFLFIATREKNNQVVLYVSKDNARTLGKIELPTGNLHARMFTVLEAAQGAVFINVFNGANEQEPWGTVYVSEATGTRYALSMLNNRRTGTSCDFHKVKSLEGVFVANEVANVDSPICNRCKSYEECNQNCHFKTKISFDRGNKWSYMRAPTSDSEGRPVNCGEKSVDGRCPLNLHGYASPRRTPILAHKSAIGIIVASGNVGDRLETKTNEVNTYLSRDGGLNWEEIAKGSFVFDAIDHGGIFLLAETEKPTFDFRFSWNQGLGWAVGNFTPTNQGVYFQSFLVPPNPTTKSFLIHGISNGDSYIYYVDFSTQFVRNCQGAGVPGTTTSDFEFFIPHTYNSEKCLLGKSIKYVRRKREAECFTNEQLEQAVFVRYCGCTKEDYNCDFGYEPSFDGHNGELVCRKIPNYYRYEGISLCLTTYLETRGYLKIPGDACIGGLDLNPLLRHCPFGFGTLGLLVLALFMVVIISILIVIIMLGARNPASRKFIAQTTKKMKEVVQSAVESTVQYTKLGQGEDDDAGGSGNGKFGLNEEEEEKEPTEFKFNNNSDRNPPSSKGFKIKQVSSSSSAVSGGSAEARKLQKKDFTRVSNDENNAFSDDD